MSASTPGNRFTATDLAPVEGIEPVDGWTLLVGDYEDSDGFTSPFYVARGPDRDVLLNVSRFDFHPTQDRFAWLAGFGFPSGVTYASGIRGPLSDHSIDAAIARYAKPRMAA